jgi:hypothetical protein
VAQHIKIQASKIDLLEFSVQSYQGGEGESAGLIAELPQQIGGSSPGDVKRVRDRKFFRKPGDVLLRIDADADDLHWRNFGLQCCQLRHFFDAWRAPGRPEVDDERLALPLRQGLLLAIDIRHGLREQSGERGRRHGPPMADEYTEAGGKYGNQKEQQEMPHFHQLSAVIRRRAMVMFTRRSVVSV